MIIRTGILGNRAEKLAKQFLKKNGLKLLEKNYRSRFGEIDIVMQHKDYIVFVVVRHRKSNTFGGALESVDKHKQKKLRNTAELYLTQHKRNDNPCRFDIICVNGDINNPEVDWIQNAF